MKRALTPSQENYLEHIHRLAARGRVRARELAEAAGVSLPSVSRAVSRLAEAGLVRHESYGEIEITAQGTAAAEAIVRRHACLERLLVDVLDMDAESAYAEVCRLEHVLDADVLSRLEELVVHATARSSRSWLAELRRRMRGRIGGGRAAAAARVGTTSLHAGETSAPADGSP
jgi:DtxR family Mn-dependent transcriptional regulator